MWTRRASAQWAGGNWRDARKAQSEICCEKAGEKRRRALHVACVRAAGLHLYLGAGEMARSAAALLAPLALLASLAAGKLVTFSNVEPRRNASGSIINAHDGTTRRYGGPGSPFYYHSIGYPACGEPGKISGCNQCIFSARNSIDVWRSPDLSSGSWEKVSTAFPSASAGFPNCTYFRAQAV